ncbi:outer membrane-stress sensor serine endopeptidase DegS [Alginatibacterium sediminis]|uniref:outer membrane-stress sensor serine endopeptidase DegS n=1 Tax=Alginatibacterium sediminis TaxID=2164068 RepID=UPI0018F72973|nr:outer membrane-stress sensor serine endopeptidase DegS [Alginatibacterium sediminis]
MSRILKYIGKPALFGLIISIVILLAFPEFRANSKRLWDDYQFIDAAVGSYSQATRRAAPAVVNIYTRNFQSTLVRDSESSTQGLGSGVIMSSEGWVLTNLHVINEADEIIVALQDGRVFNAELMGSDLITDLAVLKIESLPDLPVIPQNDELDTQVGDIVLAIGNPYNIGQTITQGIISATGRVGMSSTGRQDFLQTDAAINRGNSGGALINTRGELVGINTAAYHLGDSETYGISFAIPFKLTKKILLGLVKDGKIVRSYLGIDGLAINKQLAQRLNLKRVTGVIIQGTDPNGPAEKAGIETNDILIKINDIEIIGVREASDIVAETAPGSQIITTIIRNGEIIELPVTVTELPQPSL